MAGILWPDFQILRHVHTLLLECPVQSPLFLLPAFELSKMLQQEVESLSGSPLCNVIHRAPALCHCHEEPTRKEESAREKKGWRGSSWEHLSPNVTTCAYYVLDARRNGEIPRLQHLERFLLSFCTYTYPSEAKFSLCKASAIHKFNFRITMCAVAVSAERAGLY